MIGKIVYWTNIFNCILNDNSRHLWTEIIYTQMKECKSINFVQYWKLSDKNSIILEIKIIFIQRLIFTKYSEILKVSVFLWASYTYCKNNEIEVIDINADINISRVKWRFNCNYNYKYTRVGTRFLWPESYAKNRMWHYPHVIFFWRD